MPASSDPPAGGERVSDRARPAGQSAALGRLFAALALALAATAHAEAPRVCDAPPELLRFSRTLSHLGQRLAAHRPLSIVALGSSSTSGAGTSSPEHAYPARLAAWLSARFPGQRLTVENRGVPGAELEEMVAQLDQVLARGTPDLVVWQLGTNALLHHRAPLSLEPRLEHELDRLRKAGADVVLVGPQFAPAVRDSPDRDALLASLRAAAEASGVDLFPRYQVMRGWALARPDWDAFLAPDALHMNDWGADCLARLLARAIADAASPEEPRRPPAGPFSASPPGP